MNNSIKKYEDLKLKWNIEKYVSLFIIYSFIGWIVEVTWILFATKRFVNSGLLNLPLIPIYGIGAVLISIIFKEKDNIILIMIGGGIVATSLELISSYLLEFVFNKSFWSYDSFRFNMDGRISLLTSVLFSIASLIIVKFSNPIIERKLRRYKYNNKFELFLTIILMIIMVDFIYSSYILLK